MQIEHHGPAARGVATLMYVGDDGAAIDSVPPAPSGMEMGIGALGLGLALLAKGTPRALGAAAAAVVGLRYLRSR
jgi:hypothetical protein